MCLADVIFIEQSLEAVDSAEEVKVLNTLIQLAENDLKIAKRLGAKASVLKKLEEKLDGHRMKLSGVKSEIPK